MCILIWLFGINRNNINYVSIQICIAKKYLFQFDIETLTPCNSLVFSYAGHFQLIRISSQNGKNLSSRNNITNELTLICIIFLHSQKNAEVINLVFALLLCKYMYIHIDKTIVQNWSLVGFFLFLDSDSAKQWNNIAMNIYPK